MDNVFLALDSSGAEVPSSVYIRSDQTNRGLTYFEAISALWFDDFVERRGNAEIFFADAWKDAPIFVLEMGRQQISKLILSREGGDFPFGTWLQVTFGSTGREARIYTNLFNEGRQISIASATHAPQRIAYALNQTFALDRYVATENQIRSVWPSTAITSVHVYDVGQGSWAGLCDGQGTPLAYADLGGGVLAHHSSFPHGITGVCIRKVPPVILSHWDWDHWSSGARFPEALSLTWIAPLQTIGAVHATYAAKLISAGHLLIWPSTLSHVDIGQIRVEKCIGRYRNDSGLSVEVTGPSGQDPILLPGDAHYKFIPTAHSKTYSSIIATHHGSGMMPPITHRDIPHGGNALTSRFVYSCAHPNHFGHPTLHATNTCHQAGWPHTSQMRGNAHGMDRYTYAIRPTAGHIQLDWIPGQRLRVIPCQQHQCGQARCGLLPVQT